MKLLSVALFFILCSAKVTSTAYDKLNWTNMNEVNDKITSQPKPVIIDLYTNWCYWCKVMDKKTYNNSRVISYINDHFYAVKIDAESKEAIPWANKEYNFNDNYKVNDFAMYVTSGQPGFPTTVIFVDQKSEPVAIQGFLVPKEIEPILKYFGEGAYKTQNFMDYKKTFKTTW